MNFKDLSIKRKITYLYLPFVVLPIILFFFLSTNLYEETIFDRSLLSMEDNNELIKDQITSILNEAESSATYLTISINTLLNNQEFDGELKEDIRQYNLISNELTYAMLIHKNIDSIAFYDVNKKLYYTDYRLDIYKNKIESYEFYHELEKSSGQILWQDLEYRIFLSKASHKGVLTLGKKIWNINTGKTIGYLFINISEEVILKAINNQVSSYDLLVDGASIFEDQKTLSEDMLSFLESEEKSQIINQFNNKYVISKLPIEKVGWTLLSQTNLDDLTTDFSDLLVLLSLMLVVIIAIDILISFVLNRMITSPIIELKGGLEEISNGNFDYKFNVKTNDEIGLFADRFNHMTDRIKKLLSKVALEEEQKRTFELALIQQQIKPHFLYNTLDIILKLSEMGQHRKAQKVTKRLADYYKHSLSSGSDIVKLEDEIRITKDYLELQKIRYSDILDYNVQVSHHVKGRIIPKLTLQPLVENAIYHGLKYKKTKGQILIYDEITADGYYLIVKDNGIGIDPNKLNELKAYLGAYKLHHNQGVAESFGMRNVNYRLKLFFGTDYGLTMESIQNEGTQIRIKLPKED